MQVLISAGVMNGRKASILVMGVKDDLIAGGGEKFVDGSTIDGNLTSVGILNDLTGTDGETNLNYAENIEKRKGYKYLKPY